MIIKKEEKDNKINNLYKSSTIISSIYENDYKKLTILFKNSGSYTYLDVSKTDYLRFEVAESQGVILNTHIKKYHYVKNLNINNVNEILTEIDLIETNNENTKINDINNEIINIMTEIINDFNEKNTINKDLLVKLNKLIQPSIIL